MVEAEATGECLDCVSTLLLIFFTDFKAWCYLLSLHRLFGQKYVATVIKSICGSSTNC